MVCILYTILLWWVAGWTVAREGITSHPSRVCGLKQEEKLIKRLNECHTLHGCVD